MVIVYIILAVLALEFFMIVRKRINLVRRLKRACKDEGYTLKFLRNRFTSVFFSKGNFDLLIEGPKGNYAVVILTSRHRRAMWHFFEDIMVIFKRKSFSVLLRGRGRANTTTIATYIKRKGHIKLPFNKISTKYPLHKNVCILNPAPNEVAEVIGNKTVEAGDQHVLRSGFMLFGLSGFIRYISTYDEVFGIKI